MAHPAGESESDAARLNFDRRLKLEFHGSSVTSDAGLLAYRELDDVLGLMAIAGQTLADGRTGRNGRHDLIGMLRQSVFGRVAGYEDVNDADRLGRDPAMRWIVGGRAATKQAASTSQMGRFETEWLANDENLVALTDLGARWSDRVHSRRPLNGIVLDMDSSVSETYGDQEGTAYNGHFACNCYHPLFVFNQFGDLERCALRSGNVHSAHGWKDVLEPVVWPGIGASSSAATSEPMPPLQILRSTSSRRPNTTSTRSGCLPIRFYNRGSATCSSARSVALPSRFGGTTPTSAIRRKAGRYHAASWRRSSGTPASFIRASASSSPTCRARPSGSLPSTTSAGRASNGSRKARARSSGRGCHAGRSLRTPSGFSFMRSPTISAISCGRSQHRSRSRTGR